LRPDVPPRLLTIAGSDSGGGAGIQADLKTFAAHGAYGMSVIAAITAQNTCEVREVLVLPPALIAAQLDAVLEDLGADAVKIGMLATPEVVATVARGLRRHLAGSGVPVVLDPVMVAKSGATLLQDDAVAALRDELLSLATLVTPNLPELARLTGLPVESEEERTRAAQSLTALGPAVLAKGGHGEGDEVVDLLVTGEGVFRFAHPRVATRSTHGTGCTLSSAIAARLGAGEPLPRAVEGAIDYLTGALRAAYPLGSGQGHGPVDHLYRLFPPREGGEGLQ
jgi:hydroxymethylpyrimidine/phosphomethylpyrimidine kinase